MLTWELTGEDRWFRFIGFLLDLASAECGSQGAGQQVGLCIVSSHAPTREELLLDMGGCLAQAELHSRLTGDQ